MAKTPDPKRRKRGFERAFSLMKSPVRAAGESRGFAVARLLTHWDDVVGADIAKACRPVRVHYAKQGFGATLTLLVPGAMAPMLEMQKEQIRARVNACYGYAAISRIRLTQTAPVGFGEGAAPFASPGTRDVTPRAPDTACAARARDLAADVRDPGLRAVLERLGGKVLSKSKTKGENA